MRYTHVLFLVIFMMLAGSGVVSAQQSIDEQRIFRQDSVDVKAEYPGGINNFYQYIAKNFRVPENLKVNGKIVTEFIVEVDGSLTNFKTINDLGSGTAKQAIKLIKAGSKWSPGKKDGMPVRVRTTLPIIIRTK